MIVVLRPEYTQSDMKRIMAHLQEVGLAPSPIIGEEKTIILGIGGSEHLKIDAIDQLRADTAVEDVLVITKPYKLVAREAKPNGTQINVRGAIVGGGEIAVMAGPCTVESEQQLMQIAEMVAETGAKFLRGGAYKPSTSPYSFHGMGVEGLALLKAAGQEYDLRVVTEVMDVRKVELVAEYADILQIGTRNMQNYDLLRELGSVRKPILLKRGMSAKVEEWLLAAEYVANAGNEQIILCERGIRTFETATRNTLDLNAVPLVKQLSHLPVIVDPSHGTGKRDLVGPMSKAAIACGADGVIIEVHPNPDHSIKDGSQTMTFDRFKKLIPELSLVAQAVDRSVALPIGIEIRR
jgi:3-deoxy-7-phosphoheptulonate synthase